MYAILDIETTGGAFNEERITEIAIYRFDGHSILDKMSSLVNPEREIQPFVARLTGINSQMLRLAPKFYELAKRIIEITEDCVLVAHNADFDYRILRIEFERLGYLYERKTLCTVKLAQELLPDKDSYSLGKLSRSLGIAVADRHRATGDAEATLKLFKLLLDKDLDKKIIREHIKTERPGTVKNRHLKLIRDLPEVTGVYYFHGSDGKIIYVGKAKNIKQRVSQHFSSKDSKARRMRKNISSISYEKTGSELIALLKEAEEIKLQQPTFNHANKRTDFPHFLVYDNTKLGYHSLKITQRASKVVPLRSFSSKIQAQEYLRRITEDYRLCPKINGVEQSRHACFSYSIKKCQGACIGIENEDIYNIRVLEYVNAHSFPHQDMLIIDKGRELGERSVIWIENGQFKGMGFCELNYQILNRDILAEIITPMSANRDSHSIIQSFLIRKKNIKVIPVLKEGR